MSAASIVGARPAGSERHVFENQSLFDIDEQLSELMERVEEESAESGEIPEALAQEIADYLDAFRTKIDRIAGYWRWQESIALICGREAEWLMARKRAAENRVARLKAILYEFMELRGLAKLEGERSTIGLQQNSAASLIVDDPLQFGDGYWERSFRITRAELDEILACIGDGDLKRVLAAVRAGDGWELNTAAIRAELASQTARPGARLVRNKHIRLR